MKVNLNGVVIITADVVDPKVDIDFSRTAKTWFGRNVYSLKNEYKSDFIWHKGDIVIISDGKDMGYIGGGDSEDNIWYMSPYRLRIDRESEEYRSVVMSRREMVDILVNQGMAKVVKYDELDNSFKDKWEHAIKDDRISSSKKLSVSGKTIDMENGWYRVVQYNWVNGNRDNGSELKVVINKKVVKFILSVDEINNGEFMDGNTLISGDPFNN